MTLASELSRLSEVASDISARLRHLEAIPMVYFTATPNVGDLLNEYLIPRISGRPIVKVKRAILPHLRGIGSVLGSASALSHIWGSGSIDGAVPQRRLNAAKIYALRGTHTLEVVNRNLDDDLSGLPLGDPALLMPLFFVPPPVRPQWIGIVPHFSDEERIRHYLAQIKPGPFRVISVRQKPEAFVSELYGCEAVFSSSLHGLILADAYGIPNKWITVSDKLLGGNFKFSDYYSVTDSHFETAVEVDGAQTLADLLAHPERQCKVKAYTGSHNALLQCFPTHYHRVTQGEQLC
jgi:pyruvyltransferase